MTKTKAKKVTRRKPMRLPAPPVVDTGAGVDAVIPYDENNPLSLLTRAERVYVESRMLGDSCVESLRKAKPEWSETTCGAIAWRWENRPIIMLAIRQLQTDYAARKCDSIILSKQQRLELLSLAILTPLSEIDENSIFCNEHSIVMSERGRTDKYKKDSLATLSKAMSDIEGNDLAAAANLNIASLLKELCQQGLPQETGKVYDMEEDS